MKHIVFDTEKLDTEVHLTSYKNGKFAVKYGMQVTRNLDYSDACSELGACIMHSLTCAGNIED